MASALRVSWRTSSLVFSLVTSYPSDLPAKKRSAAGAKRSSRHWRLVPATEAPAQCRAPSHSGLRKSRFSETRICEAFTINEISW